MKYICTFTGRKINSIGITYPIETEIEAESEEKIPITLYETYEHILNLKIQVKKEQFNEPKP